LIRVCARLPEKISQVTPSISSCEITRQMRLPVDPSRPTSTSVPRWPWSFNATMAPRKVNHTNSQRETSSLTAMPELKT
jgi:hypothetical protein